MIDKATVSRILNTADIVEVVSDFVSLRRRGANYIGLCPFHNEKTPSFSVSKAKGICKCFSCGKGGSPVNFVMEHEQLSYYEALKYLAKKYHIDIVEKELTDKEREAQSEREGMNIVNEYACTHFEHNLANTPDGQDIGMSYLHERGFNENIIKRFRLGYSLDKSNALFKEATQKGYNKQYLFSTGLCIDDNRGGGYDRYKGRVVFPIFNVAGKVIGFSARTLKNDQAKYVNSPESVVYKKSLEVFGLFQAKHSIVRQNKCFLVEGNADVVSMHQAGIDNTVASLGTALTENQVQKIHRFTDNVTVIYDGDAAGIKAALKAINLLLAEGINTRLLLLPEGEDPDSFSRSHSSSDFLKYIEENETDFIRFMKRVMLDNRKNDPIERAAVIGKVVESIALIPFEIPRMVYIKECSEIFGHEEQALNRELAKAIAQNRKKEWEKKQKEENGDAVSESITQTETDNNIYIQPEEESSTRKVSDTQLNHSKKLFKYEKDLIRYIIKYGMLDFCCDSAVNQISLLTYISNELTIDNIMFSNVDYNNIFNICLSYRDEYYTEMSEFIANLQQEIIPYREEGMKKIKASFKNIDDAERQEKELEDSINAKKSKEIKEFQMHFLEKRLSSHLDDNVRRIALEMISDKHQLSKIHTKYGTIRSDDEQLFDLIPKALFNWKDAIIDCQINDLKQELSSSVNDIKLSNDIMKEINELYNVRIKLAKELGDRVVNPK